jgi:hypothetical protein
MILCLKNNLNIQHTIIGLSWIKMILIVIDLTICQMRFKAIRCATGKVKLMKWTLMILRSLMSMKSVLWNNYLN